MASISYTRFAKHVREMAPDQIRDNFFAKESKMSSLELAIEQQKRGTRVHRRLGYSMQVQFAKTFIASIVRWNGADEEDEYGEYEEEISIKADTFEDCIEVIRKTIALHDDYIETNLIAELVYQDVPEDL